MSPRWIATPPRTATMIRASCAHWLSDVLAGLSLGTAWIALLAIAYTRHGHGERVPPRASLFTALGALAVAGVLQVAGHHRADLARYARAAPTPAVLLANWRGAGWQHLAAHRTEIDGEADEPMALQWAAPAERIAAALTAAGWRVPAPWASRAALLWLLPSTPIGELPVLARFQHGEPPRLTFEHPLDDRHRLVVRLWASADRVDVAGGAPSVLWLGMVTIERAEHPVAQLAQALTAASLAVPVAPARRPAGAVDLVSRRAPRHGAGSSACRRAGWRRPDQCGAASAGGASIWSSHQTANFGSIHLAK